MELKGQIEEFIYQNDSNSYSIAVFTTEDQEVITVVGYLPFVSPRRYIKATRQNGNSSRIWRAIQNRYF